MKELKTNKNQYKGEAIETNKKHNKTLNNTEHKKQRKAGKNDTVYLRVTICLGYETVASVTEHCCLPKLGDSNAMQSLTKEICEKAGR
jgi:hypothetical protein